MGKIKLSKEDKEELKSYVEKLNCITKGSKEFCKSKGLEYTDSFRRRTSKFLSRSKLTKTLAEIKETATQADEDYRVAGTRKLTDSKYYIVTWEQNNTPLHQNLWRNILAYKEFLGAELSVILGRYKNPTSVFTDSDNETWNTVTKPYWDANRHDIHKYLTILGDVKIQPTAATPLSGLESITGETTTVIGHPKMHLKPVPVLEGHPKKILLTTGAVTVPNYTDSKAGKRGEFNHTLGFTIIEIKDDEVFFIRQVEADLDGNFIDLYYEVKDGEIFNLDKAEALVWGDTHVNALNKDILKPTFELIDRLAIDTEVHHDLLDGESVNNHIEKDPIQQFFRFKEGKDCVESELNQALDFLRERDTRKIVVQANHNDRLDRWILNNDWKKDIKNSLTYLKLATAALEGRARKGILAYLIEDEFTSDEVLCLDHDDSYLIGTYEVAHHGHIGANGSRGTIEQFRRMSTKMVIGHSHCPQRIDKVLSVGTSTNLREGYNKGASSWLNSHVVIHKNNTAQHIIFVSGEFTTFE